MFHQEKKVDIEEKERTETNELNLNLFWQEQKLPNTSYPCCSPFFFYNWKVTQTNGAEI